MKINNSPSLYYRRSQAIKDLSSAFGSWRVWVSLAWRDIKLRYQRSILGPIWITISMAVIVYTLGFMYGVLFRVELVVYFPHIASGIICWSFLAALLTDSSQIFIDSENYLKNIALSPLVYIFRLILRSIIIFLHNLLVFLPIVLYFKLSIVYYFLLPIGVLILAINALFYGTLIALLGARYRDMLPILTSLIQVAFYITPVLWIPSLLPEKYNFIVAWNPFNHFLNLIRNPLLGNGWEWVGIFFVFIVTLFGFGLFYTVYNRFRKRLVFWL